MATTQKENISIGTRKEPIKGNLILKQGPRKALGDSTLNLISHHKNVLKGKDAFIQPRDTLASKLRNAAVATTKEKEKHILKPPTKSVHKVEPHATSASNIAIKSKPIKEKKTIITTDTTNLAVNLKNLSLQVTSSIKETLPEEEIDEKDFNNPILLGNYVQDIYNYLFNLEKKNCVRPHYLKNHPNLRESMRSVLIDWLVEVHQEFKLQQETLFLTVAILDRFLQSTTIASRNNLQLIGVGCMMIACKYEELSFPEIANIVYITDNTYTADEILSIERAILRQIDFNLSIPLQSHFLRRFSKLGNVHMRHHTLAKYLMELTLIDHEWSHVPASAVAAGSLYLSLLIHFNFQEDLWTNTLCSNSRYSAEDLKPVIASLARLLIKSPKSRFKAVTEKYKSQKHLKIVQSVPLQSQDLIKLAAL